MGRAKMPIGGGDNIKDEINEQVSTIAQIADDFNIEITSPTGNNKQILQINNANLQLIKGKDIKTLDRVSIIASTLPFSFSTGCGCVHDDEIHIFSGTKHYKFNGIEWTSVSTTPFTVNVGSTATSYNGELHLIGAGGTSYHYKFDGSSWIKVSTLPTSIKYGVALSHGGELHLLDNQGISYTYISNGSVSSESSGVGKYYKWNGTSWTTVTQLPLAQHSSSSYYNVYWDGVFVGDDLYISSRCFDNLRSSYPSNYYKLYKLVDGVFTYITDKVLGPGCSKVIFLNGKIHSVGRYFTNETQNGTRRNSYYEYDINTDTYKQIGVDGDLPFNPTNESLFLVYKGKAYLLGGSDSKNYHGQWQANCLAILKCTAYV